MLLKPGLKLKFSIRRLLVRSFFFSRLLFFGFKFNFENQVSSEDLLDIVKTQGKSLIRWGDGESNFYHYGTTASQKEDHRFVPEIREILENYSASSTYVLCIPSEIELKMKKSHYFRSPWRDTAALLSIKFNNKICFGNSFIFRDSKHEFKKSSDLEKRRGIAMSLTYLSESKNRLFLISSKSEHREAFDFNLRSKVEQILIPRVDALSELENVVEMFNSDFSGLSKDDIVFVSGGIFGKILVLRLSKIGICAVDLGGALKIFEKSRS